MGRLDVRGPDHTEAGSIPVTGIVDSWKFSGGLIDD